MNDALTWIAVLGAGGGGSIITFITFWMALSSRISDAEGRAKAAEERAKSADVLASAAIAKLEFVQREMHQDRVEIGERVAALDAITQANTKSLAQAETRLAKSIEDIGEKMDHLSDTIIKTLGELIGRQNK